MRQSQSLLDMDEAVLLVLLAGNDPLVEDAHRGHDGSTQPAGDRSFRFLVGGEHLHLWTVSAEIRLQQFPLQPVRRSRETGTPAHELDVEEHQVRLVLGDRVAAVAPNRPETIRSGAS